jgi:predicted YcjX-like family ATPase
LEDLRQGLGERLSAFRPGRAGFLTQLLSGRRVNRILFAATQADHLHHEQHGHLSRIMDALVRGARDRARFAGAQTEAMCLAGLRVTTEDRLHHDGRDVGVVRGRLLDQDKTVAFYPGALPDDPARLLEPAKAGAADWPDGEYQRMRFAPAEMTLKPGDGLPHIRMDRAIEFLIGDRL